MKLNIEEIKIKQKLVLTKGSLMISKHKINLIEGRNGAGKTLLLNYIHLKTSLDTTLINQKNDEIIGGLGIQGNFLMTLPEKKIYEAETLLKKFDAHYLMDSNPRCLSGGEKRLIALIRGMISGAEYILLDEPTNDLDFKKVDILLELLTELCQKKTVIVITHDDRLKEVCHTKHKIIEKTLFCMGEIDEKSIPQKNRLVSSAPQRIKIIGFVNFFLRNWFDFAIPTGKYGQNMLQKIFKPNFFAPLCICVGLIFSYFSFEDIQTLDFPDLDELPANQVEIFSPLTMQIQNLNRSLPIGILDFIVNMETLPTRRMVEERVHEIDNKPLTFNLEALEIKGVDIFPLEYWQQSTRMFHLPGQTYLDDLLGYGFGEAYLDMSNYLSGNWSFNLGDNKIAFDRGFYQRAIDHLFDSYDSHPTPLKLTYAVLLFEEEANLFDIFQDKQMETILKGNYYIRSQQILEILHEIKVIEALRTFRNQLVGISVAVMVVIVLYTVIYLRLYGKKIAILRDYGFDFQTVRLKINRRLNSQLMMNSLCGIIVIFNTILIQNSKLEGLLAGYFISLFLITALQLSNLVSRLLLAFNLKRLYSYSYRKA